MFKNTGISGQFQNKPELSALHQLLSQALENRGKQMQVVWRTPNGQIFTLIILCGHRGDPRWCLYCEQKGKRDQLFDYSSCDVMLVNNLITSSCAEASKSGRSIFAGGKTAEPAQPSAPAVENFSPEPTPSQSTNPDSSQQPNSNSPQRPNPNSAQNSNPNTPQQSASLAPQQSPKSFQPSTPKEEPLIATSRYTPPPTTPVNQTQQNLVLNPRSIDGDAIQKVMMSLRNPETGMFLSQAFLYFLEQEYFRCLRSRSSLSVIHFDIKEESSEDGGMVRRKLPPTAIVDAVLRITELKRHVDVLAHFDNDSYAVLLPHTKASGARTFAQRVIRKLSETPLAGTNGNPLAIALGAASIPEDFVDLSKLLGALDLTLDQSRKTRQPLVMFSDIKSAVSVPQ